MMFRGYTNQCPLFKSSYRPPFRSSMIPLPSVVSWHVFCLVTVVAVSRNFVDIQVGSVGPCCHQFSAVFWIHPKPPAAAIAWQYCPVATSASHHSWMTATVFPPHPGTEAVPYHPCLYLYVYGLNGNSFGMWGYVIQDPSIYKENC